MLNFLFVQNENENIGIEYLSSSLKQKGHQVNLVFFPTFISEEYEQALVYSNIIKYQPQIICFSPFSFQFPWAIKTAQYIKNRFPNIYILFGGVHVNSVPDSVMKVKCIDGIILGEADYTILEFASNFEKNKVHNTSSLWYRHQGKIVKNKLAPLVSDLDKLPYPDKDLFYKSNYGPTSRLMAYTAIGSRGCPFACTYCSNNIYQKMYLGQKRFRNRSPENLVNELIENKKKYNYPRIEFADDVLAIDIVRLKKLMKLYKKKVNVPFACFFHPQLVNENIVKFLKKGGCSWFKLGVQSANEDYRKKYLKRQETNNQIIEVSRLCKKYKLKFSFDHIFFLPGETKEHLIEAVNLYNKCRPTIINFWGLMYLPGTDIIKTAIEFKTISTQDIKSINQGNHNLSKLNLVPWYKKDGTGINTSVFMLLFILIGIVPEFVVDLLMKIRIYNLKYEIPNILLVPLKIISKIVAGQGYLYLSSLINTFQQIILRIKIFVYKQLQLPIWPIAD